MCVEAYVKACQYKVLNHILYTNTKLYKLGFTEDERCSFCQSEPKMYALKALLL